MSRSRSTETVLVPLVDRFRWTMVTRTLLAVALPVIGYATPGPHGWTALLGPSAVMLTFVLAASLVAPFGRRAVVTALTMGVLLDGCCLAWAFGILGGLGGPVGYVLVVHATSVTLLTSFRTGLKAAMWHTLVLMVAVEADAGGILDPARGSRPFPSREFGVLIAALWSATLATAAFAALNERELRRRRYDAEVLRRFAVDLEVAAHSRTIAERLARLGHEDLVAVRSLVVCFTMTSPSGDSAGSAAGMHGGGPTGVVARFGSRDDVVRTDPPLLPPGSVAASALARRRTLLAADLDPEADGYLAALLPQARNVVVVPFSSDDVARGVFMLEFGERAQPGRLAALLGAGSTPRVDRRAVASAEQAAAHAALAFGRTALMVRLQSAANVDGLTGIANRRAFDDALAHELQLAQRSGTPCAVALVDLDHFKQLNDRHGHLAGDEALRATAHALAGAARQGDTVARYGGEEFVVIMRGTGIHAAADVAERLRTAIAQAAGPVPVTASIGVAAAPAHGTDAADLLKAADEALYEAKAGGRNQVRTAQAPSGGALAAAEPEGFGRQVTSGHA